MRSAQPSSDQPDHPQRDGQGGHPASRPRASNTSHPPPASYPSRAGAPRERDPDGLGSPGRHCPAPSRNRGNDITLSDTEGRRERTPTRRSGRLLESRRWSAEPRRPGHYVSPLMRKVVLATEGAANDEYKTILVGYWHTLGARGAASRRSWQGAHLRSYVVAERRGSTTTASARIQP